MQGWRKRNEDSHLESINLGNQKDTNLFGVFDGHGGREVSVYVGNHFTEEFIKNDSYMKNDIKSALENTYLKMDEMMLSEEGRKELIEECKKSKEDSMKLRENTKNSQIELLREAIDPKEQPDAKISMFTGCTACVLCVKDKKLYFANAGDSRSILCKNGDAYAMSVDHKPELPNELKRIEKAGGWVSDGRVLGNLNLSRSLGDSEYKIDDKLKPDEQIISPLPDIKIENLNKDCDFCVIACDGVWDCKSNQEVCDFFTEKFNKNPKGKISTMIEELFDEILAPDVFTDTGVGCDNMSCIVVQFKK